jgi:hypothetical protein
MSLRTKQTLAVATGAGPTFSAATASDTAAPDPNVWVEYRSVNAASTTVTVVIPGNLESGDAYPDKAYTLAAGTGAGNIVPSELRIPLERFMADPTTGVVTITTSQQSGVTMAVVER